MYGKLIVAALCGATFSGPVLAQGTATTNPGGQTQTGQAQAGQSQATQMQTGQPTAGQAQDARGRPGSHAQVMGQQQLRRQLEQAGFRDVQVLDAAFLVQARTQDGNTVFMMINPSGSGMQGAGMSSGQGSSSGAGSTGATGGASGASGSSGAGSSTRSGSSSSPTR